MLISAGGSYIIKDSTENSYEELSWPAKQLRLTLDSQGTVQFASPGMLEVLGLTGEELIGKDWINHTIPEGSRKETRSIHQDLLAGELTSKCHQNPVLTAEGNTIVISWCKRALKNGKGERIGLIGVGEVERSTEHFSGSKDDNFGEQPSLFYSIGEAAFIHDDEGKVLAASDEAVKRLKLDREELSTSNIQDLYSPSGPSMGEKTGEFLGNGELRFEASGPARDGETGSVEIETIPVLYRGSVEFLSITRDISPRKELKDNQNRINSVRKSIRQITKFIVKSKNLADLAESSCAVLAKNLGYLGTSVALKDLDANKISVMFSEGEEKRGDWEVDLTGEVSAGKNVPEGVKELLSREEQVVNQRHGEFSGESRACTEVLTPILYRDQLVGILFASLNPEDVEVEDRELNLLKEAADNLALGRAQILSNQELSESKAELTAIYENAPLIMMLVDRERKVRKANGYVGDFVGSPVEELLGKRGGEVLRCIHHLDDPRGCGFGSECDNCQVRRTIMNTFESGESNHQIEAELPVLSDGEEPEKYTFLISTTLLQHKRDPLVLVSLEDITERKRMEEELRKSRKKYKTIFENTGAATLMIEGDSTISWVNEQFEELSGYTRDEIEGRMKASEFITSEELERMRKYHKERRASGHSVPNQYEFRFQSGEEVKDVLCNIDVIEGTDKSVASLLDISERKKAQRELEKREREMSVLLGNLPGMAYRCSNDRNWTMKFVSEGCMELTGYRPEELTDNKEISYADLILPEDRERVRETVQEGLEEKRQFTLEYRIDTRSGIIKWVWEQGRGVFDENGELENIQGFITSISKRKKAQQKLEYKEQKLRQSFVQLAETTSRVLGVRDPYTQQHEQRVATLAREVGERMGLEEGQNLGLYLGGILHDIGKIAIPETILTKPGQLKDIEWEMIKSHPEVGYNQILKDTDFPWPVAEMTLHHHERLDGTGYPDGLAGDELTTEVRILGAVDVVEAMSTRRPYRAARSEQEVIEEITTGRGTKYDPDVVDTLVAMIEEEKVTFGALKE